MMEREWTAILNRYGQDVTLLKGETSTPLRAFVQPVLSKSEEQQTQTPLGLGRQDRFLYLGPDGHPLDLDTLVAWNGREYRVQSAHLAGEGICPHWRAVLRPRDGVTE